MVARKADAEWHGGLKDGNGTVSLESGAFKGQYSFTSRFESGTGTNPEELLGAAHAGCFSMQLSALLEKNGTKAERVHTTATVTVEAQGGGFAITKVHLACEGKVPGLDEPGFQKVAEEAKNVCPVSKALAGTSINLDAKLA